MVCVCVRLSVCVCVFSPFHQLLKSSVLGAYLAEMEAAALKRVDALLRGQAGQVQLLHHLIGCVQEKNVRIAALDKSAYIHQDCHISTLVLI